MSKKIVLGLVLLSGLAACQQQPAADVYVPTAPAETAPAPITTEPVYSGKFG